MSKVTFHGPIAGLQGAMGEMVFKKYKGKTIAYMKSDAPPTEGQLTAQERFKEAAAYAKLALGDEGTAAPYELAAVQTDIPAPALCIGDFLKPPQVKQVNTAAYHGQVGDTIEIVTFDDFGVVDVRVKIGDGSSILESGNAVEAAPGSGRWTYTATTQINSVGIVDVEVSAQDRPGGTALNIVQVELS